jgi:hypothetical protein
MVHDVSLIVIKKGKWTPQIFSGIIEVDSHSLQASVLHCDVFESLCVLVENDLVLWLIRIC